MYLLSTGFVRLRRPSPVAKLLGPPGADPPKKKTKGKKSKKRNKAAK